MFALSRSAFPLSVAMAVTLILAGAACATPVPTATLAPLATHGPTPTRTPLVLIPFSRLTNGDWLEQFEGGRPNELKELPWVADGIDESERTAAEMLIAAARWDPHTFSALLQKPWLGDGVTADEIQAIEHLSLMAQYAPSLADRMLQKSWVQDEITRDEATAIRHLDFITLSDDETSQPRGIEAAVALLDMPFLDGLPRLLGG